MSASCLPDNLTVTVDVKRLSKCLIGRVIEINKIVLCIPSIEIYCGIASGAAIVKPKNGIAAILPDNLAHIVNFIGFWGIAKTTGI